MKLVFFLAGNLLFGKEIRISNIEIPGPDLDYVGTKTIWACRARAGRNKFEYQMTKCSKLKRTIFEFSNDQPRIVWQKKNLYRFLNGFEF